MSEEESKNKRKTFTFGNMSNNKSSNMPFKPSSTKTIPEVKAYPFFKNNFSLNNSFIQVVIHLFHSNNYLNEFFNELPKSSPDFMIDIQVVS